MAIIKKREENTQKRQKHSWVYRQIHWLGIEICDHTEMAAIILYHYILFNLFNLHYSYLQYSYHYLYTGSYWTYIFDLLREVSTIYQLISSFKLQL